MLNDRLGKVSVKIISELLTCTGDVWRTYTFPNLPKHIMSIPIIVYATNNPKGCYVIRDMDASGQVKVYSPVSQDVGVVLVLFNA